jgi:hypothetical protein
MIQQVYEYILNTMNPAPAYCTTYNVAKRTQKGLTCQRARVPPRATRQHSAAQPAAAAAAYRHMAAAQMFLEKFLEIFQEYLGCSHAGNAGMRNAEQSTVNENQ